ncbi:MAG TPA: ribosome rescue protein RqcH [Candidatus Bathyarchaeia archaeon]|nr:ribosome rescue protein RqcH [Candidatus Bathyarchaeia archaeon]
MHKKEFTSFDVAAVVRELKEVIRDSHVSNVYQLDSKTLLLKLHKMNSPPLNLVLEAGRKLHLTSYSLEKPSTPPAFCMALRKYLREAWLIEVDQHEFERVVIFKFKSKEGGVQLILELFSDGNFILVDGKDTILQALSYRRMRDRNILRGEPFLFAPSTGLNPFRVNKEELREGLKKFGNVEAVRALVRFLSIGGVYAEETLLRASVDKNKPCDALSDRDFNVMFDTLHNLLSYVTTGRLEPQIVLDEKNDFIDVVPFKLERYETLKNQPYASFNEALDEFYVKVSAVEKATAGIEVDKLRREAERLKRIIEDQEKTLDEAEGKAKLERHIGDLIYAHASELQVLFDKFLACLHAGKQWKELVSEVLTEKKTGALPSSFFESFDTKNLVINVHVDDLSFGLTIRMSLFENAAGFYERSKRSKQKLEGTKTALTDSREKLSRVEEQTRTVEVLEATKPVEAVKEAQKNRIKLKAWFEKFHWFISSDGFLVVAGKDAVSNEVLVKKHTEVWDIVFHSDVVGAPFVVVKTENKKPSEQVLKEAAEFAAAFSRGWRESFGSVDVYWIKPEQLSKGGPSGESVGHGAFMVRGERNWLRNVPLKLAVGIIVEDSNTQLIGGPIDAVKAKTSVYVLIMPGDLSGKELFKCVLKTLAARLPNEKRVEVLKASGEVIREFIPYSKGRILEG